MTTERTRRRALLLGSGALAALAGCAGLARRESAMQPTRTNQSTTAPTTATTRTPTSTASGSTDRVTADGTTAQSTTTDETTTTEPTTTDDGGTGGQNSQSELSPADLDIQSPSFAFASAALPADPAGHTYALMGDPDAAATATVYGNWKCPYTREFVVEHLDGIYREFVRPGDLAVRFRAVAYRGGEPHLGPDAPRAARAGLAVWATDPSQFWSYLGTVFANQPQERREWATTEVLLAFAAAAGVSGRDAVAAGAEGDRFVPPVRRTARVAPERGVTHVPRVVVGDSVTSPTVDLGETTTQLRRAVER